MAETPDGFEEQTLNIIRDDDRPDPDPKPVADRRALAAMTEEAFAAHLLECARWQARNLGRRAPEGAARAS